MSTPRDGFSRLRTSAETRVKHALAQTKRPANDIDRIYARARLKHAKFTEKYFVKQEISVSPSEKPGARPEGKIELSVPYDGQEYLTRQAMEDVASGTGEDGHRGGRAVVGHLLLHDYTKTSLDGTLGLSDRNGSVPVEILLDGDGDPGGGSQFSADRQTCVTRYDFDPDEPEVLPVKLEVGLYDPDSLELSRLDLMSPTGQWHPDLPEIISKIRQQVSFKNELLLSITVRLNIPLKSDAATPRARVSRMAIGWPTITSLRTLSLHVDDSRSKNAKNAPYAPPVRYNPEDKCLEWEDLPMFPRQRKRDDERVHYESAVMLLSIQHPGELYKQKELDISAEVEISGYLLSGLQARLYDATGHLSGGAQPELTTSVRTNATLRLDDAFAKRDFTPSQHLFFDEIIPDDMRITDIRNSLDERGFKVWPPNAGPLSRTESTVSWFLVARRQEGPDIMDLWIYVEGRHFETVEETTALGGGKINTTRRPTGDLQVFIRGTLARDSTELTQEMNALQRTLRERYGRVRQRR
jgi:hypothetical protein